jgi:hypothetical protein
MGQISNFLDFNLNPDMCLIYINPQTELLFDRLNRSVTVESTLKGTQA